MSEASGPTNDPAHLFLANQRLVPFIVNKYFRPDTRELRDEMDQEGRIALWNACLSYNPSKGAFGTYAGAAIRHRIANWLMATKGERTLAMLSKPLDEPLLDDGDLTLQDVIPSDEDVTAQAEDREILQKVMNPRAKRFRALRLVLLGLSKKAIERRLGLTWFTLSQRLQEEYRDLMEGTSRRKKKTNKRSKKRASSGTATKLQRGRKIPESGDT
jgi:RNA polymerase sigma factor (sigma-70 family)